MKLAAVLLFQIIVMGSVPGHGSVPFYNISTEDYPPYNYFDEESKQMLGYSTSKVQRMMKAAGFQYEIKLFPWMRAYNKALTGERYCVYSTARNADREKLFHWIGPLVTVEWSLFAKKGTKAAGVETIEEAKEYVVGGLEGDASLAELKSQGFKTESVVNNWLNKDKLVGQRIQLWIDDPRYIEFEEKGGANLFDYVKVVKIKSSDLYLACNIQTPQAEIEALKKALRHLR